MPDEFRSNWDLSSFARDAAAVFKKAGLTTNEHIHKIQEEAGEVSKAWLKETDRRILDECMDVILAAAVTVASLGASVEEELPKAIATQRARRSIYGSGIDTD